MSASVTVVGAADPAWDACMQSAPRDVYHLAGYHRFAEQSGQGVAFLVVVGDRRRGLAWPYLLRRIDELEGLESCEATDVTSVYGYPGPIAWGVAPDDPFLSEAWAEIVGTWRAQGAVAAFTRFHPLLGNASWATSFVDPTGAAAEGAALVVEGPTVSIDCRLDDGPARSTYKKIMRQEIAAARRAGLATRHDTEWARLPDFIRIYRATMDRAGAAQHYYVGEEEVLRLRDALGRHLHLLVTELDGSVAAAGLFTEFDDKVHAHLAGHEERLRALSPFKVLLDDARRWAHDRGAAVLHLGGGRGGREDSLLAFKRRFSPRRHSFYTGRWILDTDAYRELSATRASVRGPSAGRFFPAYRDEGDGLPSS